VKGYPAIFVNDVLVARPRDFGYFGVGDTARRYSPWLDPNSHEKFRKDLARMVDMAVRGQTETLRRERGGEDAGDAIAALPEFKLTDLAGRALTRQDLAGRVVVVEFWATWCPPCRSTLAWLGDLEKKHAGGVAVMALAVESDEKQVKEMVASLSPALHWAIGTPEVAVAFGDIVSVPTLFVFDREGKTSFVSYGAPPDLHEKAEKAIDALVKSSPQASGAAEIPAARSRREAA
jgi:thiol-disulfide isomerase/thioredoxin